MQSISIKVLPILTSNYVWFIVSDSGDAVVIDPGLGVEVLDFAKENGITIKEVLITHKHLDHTGGLRFLLDNIPYLKVYGNVDSTPYINHHIRSGNPFKILETIEVVPYNLKGHTDDMYVYYLRELGMIFTGDLLFACGCGRIFEGDSKDLYDSFQFLKALPRETLVYPAHEYSLANSQFAVLIDPANQKLARRHLEFQQKKQLNQSTLPVVLGDEFDTNPFFRAKEYDIQLRVGVQDRNSLETMARLRAMKTNLSIEKIESLMQNKDSYLNLNILNPDI